MNLMKTEVLKNPLPGNGEANRPLRSRAFAVVGALLFSLGQLEAATVETVTGGPWQDHPPYFGYVDGDTASVAQFHTPYGLALDTTGNNLYVAGAATVQIVKISPAGAVSVAAKPALT